MINSLFSKVQKYTSKLDHLVKSQNTIHKKRDTINADLGEYMQLTWTQNKFDSELK